MAEDYLVWSADWDMTENEAMEMQGDSACAVAERFVADMDDGDLDRCAPVVVRVRPRGSDCVYSCKVRVTHHVEYDVIEQTSAKAPAPEDDD